MTTPSTRQLPTPTLSTGAPSTLIEWRKLVVATFGEDSRATIYLDEKIAERGEEEPVVIDERQGLHMMARLHFGEAP